MRNILSKSILPQLNVTEFMRMMQDFYNARRVESYPWSVEVTAVHAMGFVFPIGYFGVQHSELVLLGLSEAIFFKLMAWRKHNMPNFRRYIYTYAPSADFA